MVESGSVARTVRTVCLVTVASVAIGLTGCGKVGTAVSKSPAGGRHQPRAAVAAAQRIVHPAAWASAQARGLARRMLARQAVPPGARPFRAGQRWPWALQLAENINDPGYSVRLGRAYLVPSPESVVIGFLRSHFPGGSADDSYGAGGTNPELSITYRLKTMPDGVAGTLFFAGVLADGPGRTWLRLDAMVDWCLPRTPAEHIDAARYRAVVVSGFQPAGGVTKTRTFTAPAVIAKLARQLNVMHTVGGDYYCPEFSGGDQLTFEPKPGLAPTVTVQEEPCSFLKLTVGGKAQPALGGAYDVLGYVSRLVGIG